MLQKLDWITLIEAIIIEGFNKAESMHRLPYLKFIGDGDSSVHHNIITSVNCRMSPGTDQKNFQSDVKAWIKLYLTVYQTKTVTLYMHSLAMHVSKFIDLYGSLKSFSPTRTRKTE